MSVYRRAGAQTYSYDFRFKGRRFSGDTGKTAKREAQAQERLERERAREAVAIAAAFDAPSTWELAASRYWLEVGQHHKNRETTLKNLDWLTNQIGRGTALIDITDNVVARLVARRRVEPSARQRKDPQPLSAATINRTVTQMLRKVLLRARDIWKVPIADIRWRAHILPEPRERVREASHAEETEIMARLGSYADAVEFAFLSGCRRAEICGLKWTDVDFFGRQFTVTGKGDKRATLPMSDAIHALLWRIKDQHPEYVFSFVASRTRRELEQVRGKRYPIKVDRLSHVLKDAARDGGVTDFHLHDTRHTAATRVLRVSNLRVVQHLLRHEDIATTAKYAHAVTDDIRAALNAASPTQSATTPAGTRPNDLKKQG